MMDEKKMQPTHWVRGAALGGRGTEAPKPPLISFFFICFVCEEASQRLPSADKLLPVQAPR